MKQELNWNDPWLDHTAWILDHLEDYDMTPREMMALLLIEHANKNRIDISHEWIADKLKVSVDQVEELFAGLSDKGFLTFLMDHGKICFVTEGILKTPKGEPMPKSLVEEFETAFGRGLSSPEMQRIVEMASRHGEVRTLIALDEAMAYKKRDVTYVERVLESWQKKGLSTEDLQKGYRNERK